MVNDNFASILVLNKDAIEIKTENEVSLQDANGNKMSCNGTIELNFYHNNTRFQEQFTRVKNLSQNLILGLDFLVSNKINIDYEKREVYVQSKSITIPLSITTKIQDSILYVNKNVTIGPNNAQFIDVCHSKMTRCTIKHETD